ncbi:C6 transcription factor GliZ2 [Nannizzia gypsea CBS 118893]|uniref:C6 transcription factor GliZ2 n=1 Tax=Arthroderma gypseum (strain ATCC MYA-4604 / CBS 118893) TaxID=535722 RepID=E4V754_ARTGP|nr:C6 transcription factor GliZ2 [Nannizzia gypsea CBS 118893]EFQ96920.1 C6 transcription factor GliZ2 [Nannizzia gypsea CBS 118893]
MASEMPSWEQSVPLQPRRETEQKQKLRSACDSCHQCKVKCSGGSPCFRCASKGLSCRYGYQNRAGKPKGCKNRKTIERAHRQQRIEWYSVQNQQPSTEGFEDANLSMPDFLTNLPASSISHGQWDPTSMTDPSLSPLLINSNPGFKSTGINDDGLPTLHDLDTWTVDLRSMMDVSSGSRSGSLEGLATPISFDKAESVTDNGTEPTCPATPELQIRHSPDRGLSREICTCVQSQAANIAALHKLINRDISDRFDLAMKSVTSTLDTCERFITCGVCEKSFPLILLTFSAIELIFKLFELLAVANSGLLPPGETHMLSYRLGDYKVSKEEGKAIQNVLLKMILSKGKQTLDGLHNLVNGPLEPDHGIPGQSNGSNLEISDAVTPNIHRCLSTVDQDYMSQCINRKKEEVEALMITVAV